VHELGDTRTRGIDEYKIDVVAELEVMCTSSAYAFEVVHDGYELGAVE